MKHICTLNQLRRISGGRKGYSVTLRCVGCGKTLVIDVSHALYQSWLRWKSGDTLRTVQQEKGQIDDTRPS